VKSKNVRVACSDSEFHLLSSKIDELQPQPFKIKYYIEKLRFIYLIIYVLKHFRQFVWRIIFEKNVSNNVSS